MKNSFLWDLQLWLIFILCRLLMLTWRVRVIGMDQRRRAVAENPNGSFLIATFHENAIGGVLSHPGQDIYCLSSRSKDGEIVAFICERIGLGAVRGSSSRGGKEAREEMIELLRRGKSGAITVDGPRGPRGVPKAGVIDIARKSGAPILVISAIADRKWTLTKTWDQTKIPKPFCRLLIRYAEPIFVKSDVDDSGFELTRQQVQNEIEKTNEDTEAQFESLWKASKSFSSFGDL
ncbi:MAG: lysophospholipid acyltransferase family protein [Proteobacteria bacterium]|nr:lysophospholipid acyltransferase family protein [Pseudomonadota bacterium]